MDVSPTHASDVAFTPSVKAVQARKGLRPAHQRIEERGGWRTDITPDLAAFVAAQTSVFLATANRDGQPYIQHRGGPPGFLRVLDARTIALPTTPATGNTSRSAISPTTEGASLPDRLRDPPAHQAVGEARVVETTTC